MNKEHFLIELKIYLRPLSAQQQAFVLDKYEALFDDGVAAGQSEEEVAKSLGKPKEIAEQVLEEFDIQVPEKKLTKNGWTEITGDGPQFASMPDDEPYVDPGHPYEEEYEDDYGYREPRRPHRFWRGVGLFCLNFFFMIWMWFTAFMLLFAGWITAGAFVISPILGVGSLILSFNDGGLFQLFMSLFLCGAGIIGVLILIPLSKFCVSLLKRYINWNRFVMRGGYYR